MKKYSIWVISPFGDNRQRAFDDVSICLQEAFRRIGYDVPIVTDRKKVIGRPIILATNLIDTTIYSEIPDNAILYNFEQIYSGSPWFTKNYLDMLRNHEVWDYSPLNKFNLEKLGVNQVKLCPVGYEPVISKIGNNEETIDVLMYGKVNERRQKIIDELSDNGFHAKFITNAYGEARDHYISRSKIIINVHYYPARIFEIVRVSYLLANQRFVISENGDDDELEKPFAEGVIFSDYKDLLNICRYYIDNTVLRKKVAKSGYLMFNKVRQHELLEKVI